MAKKQGKALYIAALLLFLGGVGSLLFMGFSEGSVYFLNVSEALAHPDENLKSARLFGTVNKTELTKSADGGTVRFLLTDKDHPEQTMPVSYTGALPDTFKAGAEVIVEGGTGPDRVFIARTLMTQCPSKYEKENRS